MRSFKCSFNDGQWKYLGTTEQNFAQVQREKYESNPIVKTIKALLANSESGVISMTSEALTAEMLERFGWEGKNITIDKRAISKLQADLYNYDYISYQYKKGRERIHEFTDNMGPLEWRNNKQWTSFSNQVSVWNV